MSLGFEPSTQWDAVITHCLSTNVPPQNWVFPFALCRSACQGQSPIPASWPPTILEANPLPHPSVERSYQKSVTSDGSSFLDLLTRGRARRSFQNFEKKFYSVMLKLSVAVFISWFSEKKVKSKMTDPRWQILIFLVTTKPNGGVSSTPPLHRGGGWIYVCGRRIIYCVLTRKFAFLHT